MKIFSALYSMVLLAVFLNFENLHAQCSTIPCQTPQYSDNAPGACILPNPKALDCYYGTTIPSTPQTFPPFWCTTIENNQWFAFTADATSATFEITVYDCSVGGGIQAAVLSTNDCINFDFVSPCLGNILTFTTQSLVATSLTPGDIYYLSIDGNAGAVCNFGINNVGTSAPALLNPPNGQTGVGLDVLLQWTNVNNAQYYIVDVATNPSFSSSYIVLSQNVAASSLLLSGLQPKSVYYWRLRSVGNCETGGFSTVFAFQTGAIQCDQEYRSTDIPKYIDTQIDTLGTTWAASDILVAESKVILDLNVSLEFEHPRTGDLSAYLVSPENDTVLLFDRPGVPGSPYGCEENNGLLTFDDGATETSADLEAQCSSLPPALNGVFQPISQLSALHDKNSIGQWRLALLDHEMEETGGTLTNWGISFCFLESITPGIILANSPLVILSGSTDTVSQDLLSIAVAPPSAQGVYTLTFMPRYGTLSLNGIPLEVGSIFTQDDINTGKLTYTHGNNAATYDSFHFDAIDQNNCGWVHLGVFSIQIVHNNLMASAVQTQGILCHGDSTGAIKVTATGLNGMYTYSLNGGPSQSSNIFSGLPAGTYTVVVTGQFELMDTTNVIILTNPAPLNAAATVDCNAASLVISGGTAPYTSVPPQTDLNNLPNGQYEVVVADNNGCTTTTAFSVDILLLELSVETDSVRCFGGNTGTITANTIGGCPPYTYSLGGGPFVVNNTFPNLPAGNYTLIIKDSKGNLSTLLTTISEPAMLALSVTTIGDTLDADASGGIPPYLFSLNGGQPQTSGLFPDLAPGMYTIAVTDANGCTTSKTGLTVTSKALEAIELWGAALSPNPGSGLFRLSVQKAPAELSAQVFDMAGRLLISPALRPENGKLEAMIDLQGFPNGNYLLVLSDGILQGRMLLSKASN